MSAVQALKAARAAGINLTLDGDALVLAAATAPPHAMLDLLASSKAGIVALLRTGDDGWSGEDWRALFDERAAIAEFDGGLPRASAEARAFVCCVAEWLNCNPVRSPPSLDTEQTGHAWLPSRCWKAWHESREAEAVAVLSTFEICMGTLP